jgi:carbonic anhydrase
MWSRCGSQERPENVPGHIVTLINEIKPAVAKCSHLPEVSKQRGQTNVLDKVSTLKIRILHKKIGEGDILIVGAVCDIHTGQVGP